MRIQEIHQVVRNGKRLYQTHYITKEFVKSFKKRNMFQVVSIVLHLSSRLPSQAAQVRLRLCLGVDAASLC